MNAKSIKAKTAAEALEKLDKYIKDGFAPTLGIVFISAEPELDQLRNQLSSRQIKIFGASSGSLFIDGDIEEVGIALLLLEMKPAHFSLQFLHADGNSKKPIAEQIGIIGKGLFRKPAFLILSGGLITDGDEIVDGIEDAVGKGATVFGGLASDNFDMVRTYVFTNHDQSENGLAAIILDEEAVSLSGLAYGGWQPIGNERTITSSNGNVVFTIEDEPAVNFIARYAGIKENVLENATAIMLASNFQLQLQRENKHPVMRTPMYVNKSDRSIVFAGSMPQGARVKLCLLPGFEVIDAAVAEFSRFKTQEPDADALIMFSCAGRQMALGMHVSDEIDRIKNMWEAPMIGFFCFGEIGRVAGGNHEFHNMTCSLAMLREKTSS